MVSTWSYIALFTTTLFVTESGAFLANGTDTAAWVAWSSWSDCSSTCGDGVSLRVRHCSTGGTDCAGSAYESQTCNAGACGAIDGGWGAWETWGSCSTTCALGFTSRQRRCDSPAPTNGGALCPGLSSQTIACKLRECPLDGDWSTWTAWSGCDKTCGPGSQARVRACDSPAPKNGGAACSGKSVDARSCDDGGCPVDGGWSNYTARPCSATCGTGIEVKVRTCTNPSPANGGKDCVGSPTQFAKCNQAVCIIDGGWTDWSSWSDCGVICGDGHLWRSRDCSNPVPRNGGAPCNGSALDSLVCNNGTCPTDLRVCFDSAIQALVDSSPFVVDPDARPELCNMSDTVQAQDLIQKHCSVTSKQTDWELGIQVENYCDIVPLFSPVAVINEEFGHVKYGIMLECFKENIQIVDLSCTDKLEVNNFLLNYTETNFHMLRV